MHFNKRLLLILSMFTASVVATEPKGEWLPLFNGKDLSNWDLKIRSGDAEEAKKVFSVHDGMVHVFRHHPDKFSLNSGSATHGLMYTQTEYSRYIFRFEYKWGEKIMNNFRQFQYDAGMYYHVYNDKIWPFGLEYQIRYDHTTNTNHTGDFWASNVSMQWFSDDEGKNFVAPWQGGKPQEIRLGEHRALKDAPYHALDGQWNQVEVIVMADKYAIHKLNGVVVNYATDFDHSAGLIGLQSETAEIFYRNIEILPLNEFIPASEFLP
ncbi:DUF1080 domain-containing protein [Alteromonas aestuariivivens]|uniref:DUF1080 domain-containing protein n=1 Tax=Alteromonas aestuariivivens TaxID=1938339 RepID=A0A3D8MEV7_9ALTE|nr:DUF1080 domain-containing protein [Alteromonas aestuariivivens]RDV29365.1 DUF1080 domain-containing protein [Alteromonas aestuariivivens]